MMTIKNIKSQINLIELEKVSILNTTKDFNRLLELRTLELYLKNELIKLLEIQLNKKQLIKKVG